MDTYKIGNFLQALRKAKGLTQQDLADTFEVSNKTVSKWECGQTLPELPLLKALAEFYDVTIDEILSGERSTKVIEHKKERKKNQKYFYHKIVQNFNIMCVSAFLVTLLAYILLLILTYTLYVNDIPTFVSYGVLFISICIFVLAYVIYGHIDEEFDKEYIDSYRTHKQKMLVGFIGAFISVLIMATICYTEPRNYLPVDGIILTIETFFLDSFLILLFIGIPLLIILLFLWNPKLRKKMVEKNMFFYILAGLSVMTMLIMPFGMEEGFNTDPVYLNLIIFRIDTTHLPGFIFLILLPLLMTIGSIVLAALTKKNTNFRWICYLICFIASILFLIYDQLRNPGMSTTMIIWPCLIRVIVFFITFCLSLFFFFKRKADSDKEELEQGNSEYIEEKVEISKKSQNKKKTVDKTQE